MPANDSCKIFARYARILEQPTCGTQCCPMENLSTTRRDVHRREIPGRPIDSHQIETTSRRIRSCPACFGPQDDETARLVLSQYRGLKRTFYVTTLDNGTVTTVVITSITRIGSWIYWTWVRVTLPDVSDFDLYSEVSLSSSRSSILYLFLSCGMSYTQWFYYELYCELSSVLNCEIYGQAILVIYFCAVW